LAIKNHTEARIPSSAKATDVFICDEYFDALMKTPCKPGSTGDLPLFFCLGDSTKAILCQAHYSDAFNEWCSDRYGTYSSVIERDHEIHGPRPTDEMLVGGNQLNDFKALTEEALQLITERSRDQPVIAFGFDDKKEEVLARFGNLARFVSTDAEVAQARCDMLDKTHGIVFLDKQYRVGTDIKFATEANVVILQEDDLNGEEVLQMLGRGSRAHGAYHGDVYIKGHDGFFNSRKKQFMQPTEIDFKEGAMIVQLFKAAQTATIAKGKKKAFIDTMVPVITKEWRTTIDHLFKEFEAAGQTETWDTLYKKVQHMIEK
jgi:hypothetical protein